MGADFVRSIWLVEFSRTLRPSARLDGFDVSHAQCPPVELMPSNISLHIHDCLSEPPSHLFEQYDIIHIQCFNSVVPDNNPTPVVCSMLKMLSQCCRLSERGALLADNPMRNQSQEDIFRGENSISFLGRPAQPPPLATIMMSSTLF